jgi:hypothetical protein
LVNRDVIDLFFRSLIMETAETVGIVLEYLRAEISLAEYQLDRLEDIALSIDDPDLELDLRNTAASLRKFVEGIRTLTLES